MYIPFVPLSIRESGSPIHPSIGEESNGSPHGLWPGSTVRETHPAFFCETTCRLALKNPITDPCDWYVYHGSYGHRGGTVCGELQKPWISRKMYEIFHLGFTPPETKVSSLNHPR